MTNDNTPPEKPAYPANMITLPVEKAMREINSAAIPDVNVPHSTREPIIRLPVGVKVLSLTLIVITGIQQMLSEEARASLAMTLGFIPARYSGGLPFWPGGVLSPLGHLFLHAGWMHLGVNLGMLMAFGAALEKAVGLRKFLFIYFASGLIGALCQLALFPHSEMPMVGASGAISGLFGAVVMVMYLQGMLGQGYAKLLPFILVWIATCFFFGFFGMPGAAGQQIAWSTHIGGFMAGLLLLKPVLRYGSR